MSQALINDAAALIADFDASLAKAFLSQPFNRASLVSAFRRGFTTHSDRTLVICDLLDRVVAHDIAARKYASTLAA